MYKEIFSHEHIFLKLVHFTKEIVFFIVNYSLLIIKYIQGNKGTRVPPITFNIYQCFKILCCWWWDNSNKTSLSHQMNEFSRDFRHFSSTLSSFFSLNVRLKLGQLVPSNLSCRFSWRRWYFPLRISYPKFGSCYIYVFSIRSKTLPICNMMDLRIFGTCNPTFQKPQDTS